MTDTARTARAIPTGEGGATMTALWMRAAGLAVGVLALQACTMPHSQYAPYEGYQTPAAAQPARPEYPVRDDAPAPAVSADPHDPVAQPSKSVTGGALPPAAPAGPSSANPTGFQYASTPLAPVATAFTAGSAYSVRLYPASTAPIFAAVTATHGKGRKAHPPVHVDADGRLESDATATQRIKVKKGDTIKALAARYGTTRQAIIKANHLKDVTDLKVGAPLIIPASSDDSTNARSTRTASAKGASTRTASAKSSTPKSYEVKHGDTIYAIGRKFDISPKAIEDANGFPPSTRLRTGQVLKLPGAPEEEAAAPSRRAPAAARAVATNSYARPRTAVEAPPVTDSGAAFPQARSVAPAPLGPVGPAHPIPYASLPGHLVTPPERPFVPPVASPVVEPQPPSGPPDAQVVMAGRGRFIWPVHGALLSSFGPKAGGQRNDGLDISAPDGAAVRAAATGDVVYAGNLVPGLGNLVLIKHEDGWITAYAHLSRTEVKIKDHVSQGDEIGQAGESGGATQSEVYFEIRYAPTPRDKAKPVDPALLLSSF